MAEFIAMEHAAVRRLLPLVGNGAVAHFLNRDYLEAERLLTSGCCGGDGEDDDGRGGCSWNISPAARTLLGLCLVHRGYAPDGLRELSIATELSIDRQSRIEALIMLHFGLLSSGLDEYAARVLEEASRLDEDNVIGLLSKESVSPTKRPPQVDRIVDDVSCLKTSLFYYHTRACEISLLAIALHKSNDPSFSHLESLFDIITGLIPESSPEPFTNVSLIVLEYILRWHRRQSGVDSTTKKVKKQLSASQELHEIAVLQTIQGYSHLMDRQYKEAFITLNQCIDRIFPQKSRSLKLFDNSVSRAIAILAAQAFVRIPLSDPLKNVMHCEHLITEILKWSEGMVLRREQQSGSLACYFLTLGLLYIERSTLQGARVTNSETELSTDSLEEAIRKLILVSTLKYKDDGSIGVIYETISTCCLLHGGFHIKTIWFFKFLEDYFKINSAYCHVLSDLWSLPYHVEQLNRSSIGFVELIEMLQWTMTQKEKVEYLTSARVDPRCVCIPHHYLCRLDNDEVSLRRSDKWLNCVDTSESFGKSDELILLWKKAFMDQNTRLPVEIEDMLDSILNV